MHALALGASDNVIWQGGGVSVFANYSYTATLGAGSGVVLVNPPYGIDAQLEELLSSLGELLSDGAATSSHRVSWVKR